MTGGYKLSAEFEVVKRDPNGANTTAPGPADNLLFSQIFLALPLLFVGIAQAQPHDNHSAALPPLRPRMERTLRGSVDLLVAKAKDFGCVSFRPAAQFVRIVR